jgi:hypothetical protein
MALTRRQQGRGQMQDEERQLWRVGDLECVMISCCAGAELQLREIRLKPDAAEDREIVLREMYPMKTDLYERARELRAEHERGSRR